MKLLLLFTIIGIFILSDIIFIVKVNRIDGNRHIVCIDFVFGLYKFNLLKQEIGNSSSLCSDIF